MLNSLKSRILIGVLGIILLVNITNIFLIQKKTLSVLKTAQNENALNLINTVFLNVENEYKSILFHKESSIERRKLELKNVSEIALALIQENYNQYANGLLSEDDAKQKSIKTIQQLQYDNGIGYFWINDTGQPYPRMIMHPTIPELDGTILDNPDFNLALGIRKNLFVAFVDVCLESGEGYVDYMWPKPFKDGLTEEQPKISYVKLFEQWNWVVGTGLYVDDIEADVQKRIDAVLEELKETFSKIRIAESGYMYIFNGDNEFLIHPVFEGSDGSNRINPATGNPLLEELVVASKTPSIPYEYIWNKPQYPDQYKYWKQSYVRFFEPLDWYIGSSIYIDEIFEPVQQIRRQILLTTFAFIVLSVALSLLLSNNLTKPLSKLMNVAKEIEKNGDLDGAIPISGTMETRELGLILGNMMKSIRKTGNQLRQAQKMETVGTLAGGLAHDFNNMLGGIVGTLSLIKNTLDTHDTIEKAKLEEYVSIMNECSLRASNMVQQLLSLSRKQELRLEQINLNQVIQNVVKICQSSFDKSVLISAHYHPHPAYILADANQIEQSLLNFCINAEHAMTIMRRKEDKWGGTLLIALEELKTDQFFCNTHQDARIASYFLISIKDTGIGMDMSTVAKIFNPFFTTKKTGEGSGLGLSMVYNIIKQHEGFIDVYSEPGLGSNMKIYLPALDENEIKKSNEKDKVKYASGEGLILVIDDEQSLRKTAEDILTTNGYRVLLAENGLEGLDVFKEHFLEIDAVLLDMAMPQMSGKETFIEMKKIYPEVKVILTSGFRHDERVEDLMRIGIKSFVQKPYTFDRLISVFHDLLGRD